MTAIFTVSVNLQAAAAANVCAAQTPIAAGNLTLNGALVSGGVATMDSGGYARQALFTCTGDHTGVVYTISGTVVPNGPIVTEAVTGVNGSTATSVNHWFTMTNIANSAGAPGAVTVGTNGVGSGKPIIVDRYNDQSSITLGFDVTGTVNYTLQFTANNVYNTASTPVPLWFDDGTVASKSADFGHNAAYIPGAFRVKINSGEGTVATTVAQAGH